MWVKQRHRPPQPLRTQCCQVSGSIKQRVHPWHTAYLQVLLEKPVARQWSLRRLAKNPIAISHELTQLPNEFAYVDLVPYHARQLRSMNDGHWKEQTSGYRTTCSRWLRYGDTLPVGRSQGIETTMWSLRLASREDQAGFHKPETTR